MASAVKRKAPSGLQAIYGSIIDLRRPSLVQDLNKLAALAESFSEQRPKSTKDWPDLADSLDQEGVNLWNMSGLIGKTADDDAGALVAALRLAGFRLVEAGLESKPGIEGLYALVMFDIGRNDAAASVLTSAAKYEEALRNAEDQTGTNRKAVACATIVYIASRMEASWREGNYTVAEFMSQKISEDGQRLSLITPQLRELLVVKYHQIGRSILKEPITQEGKKILDALVWLQKAVSLSDQPDAAASMSEVKVGVLRTLARAYFLSEDYDRAEATLEELMPTVDAKNDHASSEYQELRWLRLAILKRRNAADAVILDAFKSIIDHMEFSEADVTDVLQDLRTCGHQHSLVMSVHQYSLEKALRLRGPDLTCLNRLLLSLIFQAAKDGNHLRAMEGLKLAFSSVCEAETELTCVPATACLTLLWQYGERYFSAKRFTEAADWFISGSHKLFKSSCPTSAAKCFRKAALCYIEQKEFARAATIVRRCPADEAATFYVMFLAAVHQAIKALHDMRHSAGFDRKMLLLATQITHQLELKGVLLSALEALLATLTSESGSAGDAVVDAMTLIRCIIRLVLKLMSDPTAKQYVMFSRSYLLFVRPRALTKSACEQKTFALISKDVSWLWRTAYNCAVQGCSEWNECEEQICEFFDIAKGILESCCEASPVDLDGDAYVHLMNASFSAVSGKAFLTREAMTNGVVEEDQLRAVSAEISTCKKNIVNFLDQKRLPNETDVTRAQYFVHTLRVFEVEFLAQLRRWDDIAAVVAEAADSGVLATGTYEAIADILWISKECPMNVLYVSLEAILRASLDHGTFSVERFARWLRAICTIVLARNASADRLKAVGYIEQAVAVMESTNDTEEVFPPSPEKPHPYPMDERHWLLATAYNTGVESLHASSLDEAKRWFEVATTICKFIPAGRERASKVSQTYTHLLSRYGKGST
ncbi:hypothetical protein JOM56_005662 [Amanita muscaria]